MNQWKITEKTIFKSKLFRIKEQKIVGKKIKKTHDIVERTPTVVIFPLTDTGQIYLISQYRSLYDKIITEAVAGHMDGNESALKAAKRELKEETGLVASQWEELLRLENSASVIRSTMHFFLARDLEEKTANPEEGEEISLMKLPFETAINKVMDGEIKNGPTVLGLLFLDKLRREKKI